jgi:hypothetical protein
MAALAWASAFASFFVHSDEFCHRVILLEGGVCKVIEQSGYHGSLLGFGRGLVGKGTVVCRHAMNVSSLEKAAVQWIFQLFQV